jgi:hypothetical protein
MRRGAAGSGPFGVLGPLLTPYADAGRHYRELAHRLRGIAAKWRLPYTRKVLLDLARRYDTRADRIGRRPVNIGGQTWGTSGRAAEHGPIVRFGDL